MPPLHRGIGAATARAFADRGADVAITYLRTGDPDRSDAYNTARNSDASDVRKAIEALGCRCHLIEADLADADTPRQLFDEVEAELWKSPVSVLVHNASGWSKDTYASHHHTRTSRDHGCNYRSRPAKPNGTK